MMDYQIVKRMKVVVVVGKYKQIGLLDVWFANQSSRSCQRLKDDARRGEKDIGK
jgi:hypothetical protein